MNKDQRTSSLYEALVFGSTRDQIQEDLTIELSQAQLESYWSATRDTVRKEWYWKDIAMSQRPESCQKYNVWKVYCQRSALESGSRDFNWTHVSMPPSPEEITYCESLLDDDSWKSEVATQAAMMGGINAYNEVMGC